MRRPLSRSLGNESRWPVMDGRITGHQLVNRMLGHQLVNMITGHQLVNVITGH